MSKVIIKLPTIQDAPDNWWVFNIVDGFGPHTSSLKVMETYAEYKVLMIKEERYRAGFLILCLILCIISYY